MGELWIDPVKVEPRIAPGCQNVSIDMLVLMDNGAQDVAFYDHKTKTWVSADSYYDLHGKVIGYRPHDLNVRGDVSGLKRYSEILWYDSVRHGLMEEYEKLNEPERSMALVARIADEVKEAHDAARQCDRYELGKELADVMIMCMVVATQLGIDLPERIELKRLENIGRAWKHGKA